MRKIVIGVVALVALAAAAVFLLRSKEEERIEKMLRECGDAAQKGDAAGIIRHLDPECTMNDQKYPALCERLRRETQRAQGMFVDLGVSSLVEKDEADTSLHVRVRALQNVLGETDVKLKLRKSGGEWRIVRIEEVR